jgi:hypothetical protein
VSSLDILLEQEDSSTILENNKQKNSWLYWVFSGLLLGAPVLSNFQRGENISELSAPLRIQPLTSFAELLKLNYSIYSKMFIGKEEWLYLDLSDRPDLYNLRLMNELAHYVYWLYSNVHPTGDNNKLRA